MSRFVQKFCYIAVLLFITASVNAGWFQGKITELARKGDGGLIVRLNGGDSGCPANIPIRIQYDPTVFNRSDPNMVKDFYAAFLAATSTNKAISIEAYPISTGSACLGEAVILNW